MVQLQVAMYAIVKSRFQIKLKPIKGSSKKSILIFSVAGTSGCSMPFLQVLKGTIVSWDVHLNCALMACGDSGIAPKEKWLEILDFTYFSRKIIFSQSERKDKKKAILNGVSVSVVLSLETGTPKN